MPTQKQKSNKKFDEINAKLKKFITEEIVPECHEHLSPGTYETHIPYEVDCPYCDHVTLLTASLQVETLEKDDTEIPAEKEVIH